MNPLLNMIPINNPMINQFLSFMKSFNGNPQHEIDNMLKTGKITKAQYDDAYQKAKQIEPLIKQFIH